MQCRNNDVRGLVFTKLDDQLRKVCLIGVNAGSFAPGAAADLIFIDPDTPWIVDSGRMAAQAGNTPFDRVPVQGRARRIMKGGVFL